MQIGIPKEIQENENRVAATPNTVALLIKQGFTFLVEQNAGSAASFSDLTYQEAGAEISADAATVLQSDIIFKVNAPTQAEIEETYIKKYDGLYGPTYTVLDILQKVFYTNNGAREAFVELCNSKYVQQVTFDSYLYKRVQGNNPLDDLKLLGETIGCLVKGYSTAKPDVEFSNPVESLKRI